MSAWGLARPWRTCARASVAAQANSTLLNRQRGARMAQIVRSDIEPARPCRYRPCETSRVTPVRQPRSDSEESGKVVIYGVYRAQIRIEKRRVNRRTTGPQQVCKKVIVRVVDPIRVNEHVERSSKAGGRQGIQSGTVGKPEVRVRVGFDVRCSRGGGHRD